MTTYRNGQQTLAFEPVPAPSLMTADEIYVNATQSLLAKLSEDRRIERKPASIHGDFLGTYICMWANSPPDGGVMVIGMENDGSISGCLRSPVSHINDLERSGHTFCPIVHYETRHLEVRRTDGEL